MLKDSIDTEIEIKRIGENIRIARIRRKMTVTELAIKANVSRMAVTRIERGLTTISIGKVFNILGALSLLKGISDISDPQADVSQVIEEIKVIREKKNRVSHSNKKPKNLDF